MLIYVETTIPSFYFETRKQSEVVARKDWTRKWWNASTTNERRVSSLITIQELEAIPGPKRDETLAMIKELPLLEYNPHVAEIAQIYLTHKIMPHELMGDADHLALASFYKCDMLVTWNCRHLANANKFAHIRRVNTLLGLETPSLVTPLQLLERNDYED